MASSSSNVVGVHYRVGKKIGEGSFGVIFEGTNLLNNQQVAIKFVGSPSQIFAKRMKVHVLGTCMRLESPQAEVFLLNRNLERVTPHNCEMNIERIRFSLAAVSKVKIFQSYKLTSSSRHS